MRWKLVWRKPLISLTQFIALLVIVFGLFVALDLNRRAQAGRLVGRDEETLKAELEAENARQIELEATRNYVQSAVYVDDYVRSEGGYLLPGEIRIVPLPIVDAKHSSLPAEPALDPAQYARPWQAWWQLLTDVPMPTE